MAVRKDFDFQDFTAANLQQTIIAIDAEFGRGFAQKHPELVGAYLRTLGNNFWADHTNERLEDLTKAIQSLADSLNNS
jgi:hypothetical protein